MSVTIYTPQGIPMLNTEASQPLVQSTISDWADGIVVGQFDATDSRLTEMSGLTAAYKQGNSDYLWILSDAPANMIAAVKKSDASLSSVFTLSGSPSAVDWEDVQSCIVGGIPYLYIFDFGNNPNNANSRGAGVDMVIHRVPEPTISGSDETISTYTSIQCKFPTVNAPSHRDCEAAIVDPNNGDTFIITKRTAIPLVYKLPHSQSYDGVQTLTYMGEIWAVPSVKTYPLASSTDPLTVVSSTINRDGTEILLKNYSTVYLFSRSNPLTSIYDALTQTPTIMYGYVGGGYEAPYKSHPSQEPQGEGIAFDEEGINLYSNSEYQSTQGSAVGRFPLFRYDRIDGQAAIFTVQDGAGGYSGTLDTYIWDTNPDTAYGTAVTFIADNVDATEAGRRKGLLKFDLNGINIPTNAIITGARVELNIMVEGQGFLMYKMLVPWSESSTYTSLGGIANDGIKANINPDCINGINLDTYIGKIRNNIPLSTIQGWINNPSTNYGWMLDAADFTTGDGLQFSSREDVTVDNRPKLILRYAVPESVDGNLHPLRIPRLTYSGVFMSERKVTATITSPTTLALVSGCYITFRNETFRLYDTPSAKKVATSGTAQNAFEYTLVFYSSQHELATTDFIDIVSDDSHTYFNGGPIVDFIGTVELLAERIQANLDRIYTGANAWTITIDPSVGVLGSAQVSLTDSTVWDALMLVNTTAGWGLKFRVIGRTITIGVSGIAQDDVTFKYGKGLGLYEITRTNVDSSKIITRLRAYGAATNIPSDYKKDLAGYVAPTYQYIKELSIPNYCYVAGATVNAVGKGNWSVGTQYAIGDLVRYTTTGSRYYCKAIPAVGIAPTNTTYWTLWNEGYIEDSAAIAEFGVREGIFRDETIFPTLKGMLGTGGVELDSILAVEPITDEAQTSFRVWIRDIGFDINDYLNTEKPTLSITRGALTGYDFEITNVIAGVVIFPSTIGTSAYVLTLTRNSEDSAILPAIDNNIYQAQETVSGTVYLLPNSTSEIDKAKYVLTGISMPNVYVRAAEEKLLTVAQAYLDKYSVQQVTYAVGIDEIAAATNTVTWVSGGLIEGDLMPILDVDMGVYGATVSDAKLVIVQTLTITVGDGMVNKYEVVLSDEPVAGTLDAIKSQIKETGKTVVLGDRESNASARKNAVSLNNLKDVIFDTDGYFDGTHVKPNSIETLYLSVGAKSWDFLLYADIKPNAIVSGHTPNFDNITLSEGQLIHNEMRWGADTDAGHTWAIGTASITTGLTPSSIYYIYAHCARTGSSADWVVSASSITVDSESTSWHFLVGILYPSLAEGETTPHERGESITYGKTWINGRFITTGIIQSLGGKSFFDLDNGHFYIGDNANSASATKFLDMDVNGTFRMKNITIVSGSGSSVLGAYMGAYSAAVTYYKGDTVTYQGGTWRCKTASTGNTPAVGTYWEVYAAKGTDGTSVRIINNVDTSANLPTIYDNGTAYTQGKVVMLDGFLYACIHDTTAGTSPPSAYYWADMFAIVTGDGYIADDTGDLWIWNGATWSDAGQIKGDIGVGISSVVLMYLVSTSATGITVSGNTWYGTPQTMTPTNKYHWSYQTITYTDASSVDTTPAVIGVYGDQGITGAVGNYYERRYKANGSPTVAPTNPNTSLTGWEVTIPVLTISEYCWVTTGLKNGVTNDLIGEWSAPSRISGAVGNVGPSSTYNGEWSATTQYLGTETVVQSVWYYDRYYITRSDAGTITIGALPTETAYWNEYGATFESVATRTLLAQDANVANFIFHDGVLESQAQTGGIPNLSLNGTTGEITAKLGTFSGDLDAVAGTFTQLEATDGDFSTIIRGNGSVFGGDLSNQGYDYVSERGFRFLTSDVWCRGNFGSKARTALVVLGATARYYTKGLDTNYYVEVNLESVGSGGSLYYKLPLYGTTGDAAGFPVDLVIFRLSVACRYWFTYGTQGKKITLINVNDDIPAYYYYNGDLMLMNGGCTRDCLFMGNLFLPAQATNILGYGIILGTECDNNW